LIPLALNAAISLGKAFGQTLVSIIHHERIDEVPIYASTDFNLSDAALRDDESSLQSHAEIEQGFKHGKMHFCI